MPKKFDSFLKFNFSVLFFGIFFLNPVQVSANLAPQMCEEKPQMQKNILTSYPRSSYIDCKQNSVLCENASQPQVDAQVVLLAKSTPKPILKPSPTTTTTTPSPTPLTTPTPPPATQAPSAGSLSADKLFDMINAHRAGKGLPAYEKESRLCELANSRGPELHNEIYGSGYIHQGFRERNIPFWITENMISKETEEAAFAWWLNSSVHHAGIDSSKQFACGACVANSCVMLFTSWEPK